MENLTPMVKQYLEIKKKFPGALLFFRLGDFYELFYEDAKIGARELDIALTSRQKDSPNPIPMCGVPHHSASNYISKLIKKGYKVAICEQVEEPSKGKKLVRREVVRIITPGTAVIDETYNNVWLAAISASGETIGISFLEVSTGEFLASEIKGTEAWEKALEEMQSFAPKELLFPQSLTPLIEIKFSAENFSFLKTFTPLEDYRFDLEECRELLKKQFQVKELKPFEIEDKPEVIRACGVVLAYAHETQRSSAEHISEIRFFHDKDFMILDTPTLRNLEILESFGEYSKRSLFHVIDKTMTNMGSRLLKSWLLRPSIRKVEIQTRLDAVNELVNPILRSKLRDPMKNVSDLERLIGKLNLATITPRELLSLANSLSKNPEIINALSDAQSSLLVVLRESIHPLPEVQKLIFDAISEETATTPSEGSVIKDGFSAELDELRKVSSNAKQVIATFEDEERRRTGIVNLKVKFNNVFGYFIEVSKGNLGRVPADYERKQTLTNAERFTTKKLKEWEEKVLSAEERIKELENQIFIEIRERVREKTKILQTTARALATLDVLQSLAEVANVRNYCYPLIHDTDEIEIKEGRHPIVEAFSNDPFVPNDLYMNNSTDRLLIITGPNMGGKSTFLRQIALTQVLAQIGSFVPASFARLPIVDRIWTRVGASDDIASGRSTFMVEMTETATILRNATPKSLILLDEIGRGTSTFDGLAIAWAVAEYLHNSPEHSAKTLFATHYHELTELAEILPGAKNYQIVAVEQDGKVIFLHKLQKGKASKSYGIAVAQLAGLPEKVIARAREVLKRLEKYELAVFAEESKAIKKASANQIAKQATLFSLINETAIEELKTLDLDSLSDAELRSRIQQIRGKLI